MMNKALWTSALTMLVAGGTLMTTGCGTAPPAVKDDRVSSDEYPRVQATGGLNKLMRVNNAQESQQNGILFSNVDIRWLGKETVYYDYRFIFFDSRGRPISPDSAWKRGESAPGTVDYLSANATTPDATDWRLEIRPRR
jgi:hypothetical protein